MSVKEQFPGELETLRADNMRLRRLLQLSEQQARAADPDQATLTGAPESPVNMESTPEDKVRFYLDLFRCRSDVYALRWENRRDGRSGWMPAIRGYWRKGMNRADAAYLPLTPDVIDQHLRSDVHIGLYPLGDDDTCWWIAVDFDKEAAMLDALAFLKAARAHRVSAALEVSQSGRGAHVWIFFAKATSATVARHIATSLLGAAFQLRGSVAMTDCFPPKMSTPAAAWATSSPHPSTGNAASTAQRSSSTRRRWNPSTTNGPTCPALQDCQPMTWPGYVAHYPILRSVIVYAGCSCPRRRRSCPGRRRSSGQRSHPESP